MAKSSTKPAWQGVTSRCLRSVRHDRESQRLDVEFRKSGAQYRYSGVSTRTANGLKNSDSVGRYFVRNVRNNYAYSKLRSGSSKRRKGKR